MTPTAVSDAELLAQARDGDEAAFTELYVRHQAAARRLANAYARAGDPEDLVNESFERVLAALRHGAGPTEGFRAYLFVTLRRLAAGRIAKLRDEPVEEVPEPVRAEDQSSPLDPADRQLVVAAYESLPERWQAVLWQTAVEGRAPRDLAPALNMSANAAAALAYRAREKLRQAYLQAHLQAAPRPLCEPHRSRLGAYVRDGLSRRDRSTTEAHLDDCGDCRSLVGELADVNRMLVRSLWPIFAATTGSQIGAVAIGGAAATGGRAALLGRRAVNKARSNPAVAVGVALVAAIAFALVAARSDNSGLEDEASPSQGEKSQNSPESPELPPPDTPVEVPPEDPPPRQIVPILAIAPTTTTATEPPSPGTPPTTRPRPATTSPQPTVVPPPTPPTTPTTRPTPPTTAPRPPHDVPYLVVVWLDATAELRITLHNPTGQTTAPLALDVKLSAGAKIHGSPSGCGLLTTLVTQANCGISPVGPGGSKTVTVGISVSGSRPTATIGVCEARLLSLNCNGGQLASLVTTL